VKGGKGKGGKDDGRKGKKEGSGKYLRSFLFSLSPIFSLRPFPFPHL